MSVHYDIAIVGAGMAGASLAAECAGYAKVVVLEGEDTPGYHTTGRSAAFWEQTYGGPGVVPLTLASGDFLRDHGFLTRRGGLYLAREADAPILETFLDRYAGSGVEIARYDRADLLGVHPDLDPRWTCGLYLPDCADIDVAGLHQHYISQMRQGGVELQLRWRVEAIARDGDRWVLGDSRGRRVTATRIVDAAGSWADGVARMAGARALGITPFRRTVAQLRTDPAPRPDLPLTLDINGRFYFKPEAGRLWLSPHDEEPSEPCDAAPEEAAIAHAIDRFAHVLGWKVEAVERKWAGLRSFAPDRLPVFGYDEDAPGFFWCAGQGGTGIQTAPAAARLCAQLLLDLPRDAMTRGLDAALFAPGRFGRSRNRGS
ncbi:glycerol-3-phosphate dehydrogenase [Blastomonas marina]|uniref:Glycerol-3-phosphate dehydrogenase n=2 Tax=Blastomonas marina TaxID=1867408 RepID=A0ABQ1FG28_9SPHN|nr:FAD-dependent oxidoreductase [Blastomonas marina]GGA08568.1 glycerol-3-phosphate dehydrogenase [Blastomonas marina]